MMRPQKFFTKYIYTFFYAFVIQRFTSDNTFQLGIIHSTEKKPDIHSYLKPIIAEMLELEKKPLRVILNGKPFATSTIHCLCFAGDGLECNTLLGFAGHTSTYGCRFCLTRGVRRTDKDTSGMYFRYTGQELRSHESLIHTEKRQDYVSYLRFIYSTYASIDFEFLLTIVCV